MEHEQYDGPDDMAEIDFKLSAIEHRETREGRHELIDCLLEDNPVIARAFYNAYSCLVDAGFDEAQAMELIIARGWHLSEGD